MMFSRILAVVLIIAATLWIGSGVLGRTEAPDATHGEAKPAAPTAQPLFQVAVIPVTTEQHSRILSLAGRTEADNRASAIARTAGSIVELNVKRGDRVKEGDVIATLSDEAREARVAEAQAMVDQKQIDLEAKMKLISRGVIAANEKNALEAELRAAEAALAMAKAEYDRGLIIAPISGVVSGSPMTTGQAVDANMMVAEVIALDPMLAVAEVAERQLGAIKVGDEAGVRLVTGRTAKGIVRYVAPTATAGTRTYRVEVELDNSDFSIPDGVTAEVEFKLSPIASARVPRSALTFSAAGELSVRVVKPYGTVASIPVGIVEDARDEICISGPRDDEKVIVQGQDFVKDGQKVGTIDAADAPAAAVTSQS
jgi:multidrug efflux system membrane fusion protein